MFARLKARSGPVLEAERLVLRLPRRNDFDNWFDLRSRNRSFLMPFEPRWPDAPPTRTTFTKRVRRARRLAAEGSEFSFLIFEHSSGHQKMAGGITLSNIRYNAACHANLGYWQGEEFCGRGLMSQAVGLVLTFAFERLHLHRVHAACLPDNQRSVNVLERNGFVREGFARAYLQINGQRADHVLFGLTRDRFHRYGKNR